MQRYPWSRLKSFACVLLEHTLGIFMHLKSFNLVKKKRKHIKFRKLFSYGNDYCREPKYCNTHLWIIHKLSLSMCVAKDCRKVKNVLSLWYKKIGPFYFVTLLRKSINILPCAKEILSRYLQNSSNMFKFIIYLNIFWCQLNIE